MPGSLALLAGRGAAITPGAGRCLATWADVWGLVAYTGEVLVLWGVLWAFMSLIPSGGR